MGSARPLFLRTRLARRILLFFVASALVPTCVLAGFAYWRVRDELLTQGRAHLDATAKTSGMALLERLQGLELELELIDGAIARGVPHTQAVAPTSRFARVLIEEASGRLVALHGDGSLPLPSRSNAVRERLRAGGTALVVGPGANGPAAYLGRAIGSAPSATATLWAEIDGPHLWTGNGPSADEAEGLCIIDDATGLVLECPLLTESTDQRRLRAITAGAPRGSFVWDAPNGRLLASQWPLFLKYAYGAPAWRVIVAGPVSAALAPVSRFATTFWLGVALSLVVVFLLSNIQIRRSTEPVERLSEGARRVGAGDFSAPVIVASGDELEELARSFNTMSTELRGQFASLTAIEHIDRSVLGVRDATFLTETVLQHYREAHPCDRIVVALAEGAAQRWRVAAAHGTGPSVEFDVVPTGSELAELHEGGDIAVDGAMRSYLAPGGRPGTVYAVFPLRFDHDLLGAIALGFETGELPGVDERRAMRRLADRVALATSNLRLLDRMRALSIGTMTAFARAIDANSPWTAGHSERVTRLGVTVGEHLGLSRDELDTLERGGLLHDVGKIGVPATILDKPAALSDAELALMREHPAMGARILAPIGPFADIIPIVLHHHEKFDGTGYPHGLAAEEIPLLARVLAIADVYDALVSDRPYRAGWTHDDAVRFIIGQSGVHFDPQVVAAFSRAVDVEMREGLVVVGTPRPGVVQAMR
jgi:HD-GYP domain-containing protein (c-di-GMP phosphodiesterase class II)/HAMP domain-containing protein